MLVIHENEVERVEFPCTLIKGRDWHPAPPWYGYCDSCTDVDGAPVGTVSYIESDIDDWFYEHTIQDDAR